MNRAEISAELFLSNFTDKPNMAYHNERKSPMANLTNPDMVYYIITIKNKVKKLK